MCAKRSSDFREYPFLHADEFAETCHQLDRRYRRAALGPLRKQWKLNVISALDACFALGPEYSTYVQIVRPITAAELALDDAGLSVQLGGFSLGAVDEDTAAHVGADQHMMDLEDADSSALPSRPTLEELPSVTYEVHLHPTYRVPCLWFSLRGLPADEPALDLDTVFRRLVPDQFKERLRTQGPIGAISADVSKSGYAPFRVSSEFRAGRSILTRCVLFLSFFFVSPAYLQHHPITGLPTFFIHPCLLGDAMSDFGCSREDYLMVWLGLVGGCVGLWVPTEMALA
ncbi:hypothetical protein RB594_005237 [Gaeumannomyces avenae]